jgi:hypothetical protein
LGLLLLVLLLRARLSELQTAKLLLLLLCYGMRACNG